MLGPTGAVLILAWILCARGEAGVTGALRGAIVRAPRRGVFSRRRASGGRTMGVMLGCRGIEREDLMGGARLRLGHRKWSH